MTERLAHAQGCAERGDPGLGHERRGHPLHYRERGRDPRPYPRIVRDLQAVIGREMEAQIRERFGGDPDADRRLRRRRLERHRRLPPVRRARGRAARRRRGRGPGARHGRARGIAGRGDGSACCTATKSYVLQTEDGQIREAHSISAGLDYPAIGPEHAYLKDEGLAEYASVTDEEALEGFQTCSRLEGIIPALETAHAIFYAEKVAKELGPGRTSSSTSPGRGDKDVEVVADALGVGAEEAEEVPGEG